MTLDKIKTGETFLIKKITIKDSLVLRPMVKGLVEGSKVKCLSRFADLIELELEKNRLAVSKDVAARYSCMKLD